MSRYLNPYTDFGFKKLFGEVGNKDLLIDFLNQLLPAHHQIQHLSFKNTENLPDLPSERKAIFDISCRSVSGEDFIVEMQQAKLQFFRDRALFYITFPLREQAKLGDWNFQLAPIYYIAILDFQYDEDLVQQRLLREVALKDQDGALFYDKLHFKFLQMPLFTKTEAELTSHFDKWLYFLKNLPNFDHIPSILNEPLFRKAFATLETAKLTPKQREFYHKSLLSYQELKGVVDTAREEGLAEGLQQGREEGIQEGKLAGIIQVAQTMKQNGLPLKLIQQVTGLTSRELNQLEKG